ncbi:MAG: hypoxanthine phosphoribosyltransferase [Desulfatitalea sp.]|nr:hypoxanthine phosphoribosyltransferase [Desulfatitalea sp.]MBI5895756.1 hypoxanthine phosphoribosyltransferase [Desulfobacterales bacterium]
MPDLTPVLDKETIAQKVDQIARQISYDYKDANLVMLGVLKGAFVFMADLLRRLDLKQVTVDFVRLESYGDGADSSGQIRMVKDVEVDIRDKDVLIVEDILDTGLTLDYLKRHLERLQPRSIKICVMIDKFERRKVDVQAQYVGHKVKEGFLVGYGLDYAEAYRHLPGIFHLTF